MRKTQDVLGKWFYGNLPSLPYGEETSYRKAIEFLDGPYIIEDWGCGVAYAKRFVKEGQYIGIDGSKSLHRDKVADLRTYRSNASAILIRHILEHNFEWQKILENALASFQKKLVLILFTPFAETTKQIGCTLRGVPDLSFRKEDLMEYLAPFKPVEESLQTDTQYGQEHMFYLTRD